jgi:hypothetical protein
LALFSSLASEGDWPVAFETVCNLHRNRVWSVRVCAFVGALGCTGWFVKKQKATMFAERNHGGRGGMSTQGAVKWQVGLK